jgi:glutamate dehydrogenase/leucine dehydrogenase
MHVFEAAQDFERVVFATDPSAGLRTIIAIHSTKLGPAVGGLRIQPYPDEDAALRDVVRLAESMTWKAAAAGLDLGGGKAVIIADPARDKSEFLLRAFGRVVDSLGGRYLTSVDVGSSTEDLDEVRRETKWVVGTSPFNGGSGDPSPITAHGVRAGMRSCLHQVFRDTNLAGRRVAIQGAGKVGYSLAGLLVAEGADVVVADTNVDNVGRAVRDFGVDTFPPEEILEAECDVLAPCALGGVINDDVVPRLKCRIVCGSANNQLQDVDDADALRRAGILYAPDFIVNSGGLISVADEITGWNRDRVLSRVEKIGRTLLDVFHLAQVLNVSTAEAAIEYAKRRIRKLGQLNR